MSSKKRKKLEETFSIDPEIARVCLASSDPARTLADITKYYNTAHIYDVLEILDMKDEIEEIAFLEREAKRQQEISIANQGKVR